MEDQEQLQQCFSNNRNNTTDNAEHHQQHVFSNNNNNANPTTNPLLFFTTPITLQFVDVGYKIKIDSNSETTRTSSSSSAAFKNLFSINCVQHHQEQTIVSTSSNERTILQGITGEAKPGELLAILGPSGSGKSTLLNLLSGRLPSPHAGSIRRRPSTTRVAYVAQDDLLYPHLTVRETLTYSALLRLPKQLSKLQKLAAVESAMRDLGLLTCSETRVGNAFVRGISGGERRRLSLAIEIMLDPPLILLDEPTSGLDSTAAMLVIAAVKELAKKGKTVVAAVHQPSSRVYQMFDSVLLLAAEGNQIYFGRAGDAMDYFAGVGFVSKFQVNPADFLLDLANGFTQIDYQGEAGRANVKESLFSAYNLYLAPKVKTSIEASAASDAIQNGSRKTSTRKETKNFTRISWLSQFTILLQRSLKERKHETFNSLRVFQVIAAAILGGTMWWHSSIDHVRDRMGLLFFITIFWGVFPSFNSVFTFPQERAVLIKERASGMYSISAYFMARMVGDLPMELILPTIFVIISYWMAGLRPEFEAFMLTLVILQGYVLVAQGLGLALGAFIMDAKRASTLVTVIMLAFLLTGGFYVKHVPASISWLKYTSFTYYCYRLLIDVQYRGMDVGSFLHHRDEELELQGEVSVSVCVAVLLVMFAAFRVLAYVALWRMKV